MAQFYIGFFAVFFGLLSSCDINPQAAKSEADTSAPQEEQYQVFNATFELPAVSVQNQKEESFIFKDFLEQDKAYFVQFMFTSCPTICPVMSGHFASLQDQIKPHNEDIQLISVSIDAKYDTPQRLAAYGEKFNAAPYWTFLRGKKKDIRDLQYAFDNYTENKMSHRPVTFFRPPRSESWKVFEGFITGKEMWEEYLEAVNL